MTIVSGGAALASDLLEEHDSDGTHTINKVLVSAMGGNGSANQVILSDGDGTFSFGSAGGKLLQVQKTLNVAMSTGTTAIASDDTVPQITEGDEFITVAITPAHTANRLWIVAVVNCSVVTTGRDMKVMLFQDTTAAALAASAQWGGGDEPQNITLVHEMAAGTTSETTFRLRAGAEAGTFRLNGWSGARKLGGVLQSSLTVWEID